MTEETCPVETPAVGSTVKVKLGDEVAPPEQLKEEQKKGWVAFFAGEPCPGDPYEKPINWFNNGWEHAKCHKACEESYTWTFTGTEKTEEGWFAVLEREEVNSYNDVMNGSGTGLGTHTVTKKVKLA